MSEAGLVVLVVLVVGVEESIRPRVGQCSGCTRWRGQSGGRVGVVATSSERAAEVVARQEFDGLAVTAGHVGRVEKGSGAVRRA